jgi:hypothetical protein
MKRIATDVEVFHLGFADLDPLLIDRGSRTASTFRPVLVIVAAIRLMIVACAALG